MVAVACGNNCRLGAMNTDRQTERRGEDEAGFLGGDVARRLVTFATFASTFHTFAQAQAILLVPFPSDCLSLQQQPDNGTDAHPETHENNQDQPVSLAPLTHAIAAIYTTDL
ncbi:hypothetical protein RB195_016600 [Necator americanus]|uniref:Uncharacterized protein n=1 Tax=Necator americanus TaxID=51031 RepID=A0ABR1C1A8_NECAM